MPGPLTDDELRDYAATIIHEHARDVERLSIFEMAETYVDGGTISDDDARKVTDLITTALIVVSFPDVPGLEYQSPTPDGGAE